MLQSEVITMSSLSVNIQEKTIQNHELSNSNMWKKSISNYRITPVIWTKWKGEIQPLPLYSYLQTALSTHRAGDCSYKYSSI